MMNEEQFNNKFTFSPLPSRPQADHFVELWLQSLFMDSSKLFGR